MTIGGDSESPAMHDSFNAESTFTANTTLRDSAEMCSNTCMYWYKHIRSACVQCLCQLMYEIWSQKTKARHTLATLLYSTRSTLLKVDCCRNRQQSRPYMFNFVAGFGNKSATTLINFVADTVDFVASVYGAKATEFNYVVSVYLKRYRAIRHRKKHCDMFTCLDMIPECDRRMAPVAKRCYT